MNIALSAVIIFILLLPPIVFYISFVFGKFQKANPRVGLLEGVMFSAVFAVVMHSTSLLFIKGEIRFDILALLIGGDLKTINTLVPNKEFRKYFQQFTLYTSILTIIAIVSGRYLRWRLYKSRYHVKSEIFRLYSHWWYLFNGYNIKDYNDQQNPRLFDFVFVDALVNTNAGTMLYSGCLVDFVCHGEALDRICLSGTQKREFKITGMNEKGNILINEPGPSKTIKGDTMSIPYTSIININLHFLSISGKAEETLEETIQE
jgi:hypothetical protein